MFECSRTWIVSSAVIFTGLASNGGRVYHPTVAHDGRRWTPAAVRLALLQAQRQQRHEHLPRIERAVVADQRVRLLALRERADELMVAAGQQDQLTGATARCR